MYPSWGTGAEYLGPLFHTAGAYNQRNPSGSSGQAGLKSDFCEKSHPGVKGFEHFRASGGTGGYVIMNKGQVHLDGSHSSALLN